MRVTWHALTAPRKEGQTMWDAARDRFTREGSRCRPFRGPNPGGLCADLHFLGAV